MLRFLAGLSFIVSCLAIAQDDFGGLNRFAAANAELGSPAAGEERIVFFGDSITAGWPDASPEFFASDGYVERGISGQTTAQMLLRFRADVVALEPAAVVILAGTNDIAGNTGPATNEQIQQNIESMAEIAAANGIRVVLASILPTDDYPWSPGLEPAPRIAAINGWLSDYAAANGHVYLDYHSRLVGTEGAMQSRFTTDGVHVSVAGYAVMELLAETALANALGRPPPAALRPTSQAGESAEAPAAIGFEPIPRCARTSGSRRSINCD